MYTKEQLKEIVKEFRKSDFAKLKGGTSKELKKVNEVWPNLMSNTKVLTYWIKCNTNEDFIDSLFCKHCHSFMPNKANWAPNYCSKECRLAEHNWSKNSESRKLLEDKWEQKYGCRNPLGSRIVRTKVKATLKKRYGVEHNWAKGSKSWEHIRQTNLKKYGVEYVTQAEQMKEKSKQTLLEHYGVETPMRSEEIKSKVEATNIRKYGVKHVWCKDSPLKEQMIQTNLQRYGVPYYCMTDEYRKASSAIISKVNKWFHSLLENAGIQTEFEYTIGWYSYDLHILDTNILIDINPSFTHSTTPGISNFKPKCIEYHYNRYKNTLVNGYQLLQVWDWDDVDKVIQNLLPRKRLGARKCYILEVSSKVAKDFYDKYHYQNSTRYCGKSYGLFYDDLLVQVMSFVKPRYNKNYEWELLRLCTLPQYSIIGGASKLLKHFENENKPKSLLSYCDLSKFNGRVYEQLGFEEKSLSISKHWYNTTTKQHFTDNLLRFQGADRLIGTNFGKGTSNEDIMKLYGFIEVYDAGQKTFVKQYE